MVFLGEIAELHGISKQMCSSIMLCVTSVSYSLKINGKQHEKFKGGRGL